jgi:hypothetical protein
VLRDVIVQLDHSRAFPGDNGIPFGLLGTEQQAFLELNAVRRELGLLVYEDPPGAPRALPQCNRSARTATARAALSTERSLEDRSGNALIHWSHQLNLVPFGSDPLKTLLIHPFNAYCGMDRNWVFNLSTN